MKKIVFALVSLFMCLSFQSCSETTKDVIYQIGFSVTSASKYTADSKLQAAITEVGDKISAFESANKSQWIISVKDDKTSSSDKDAKSKFSSIASSWTKLQSECQSILDNCDGTGSYSLKEEIYVSRDNSTLDSQEISLSYQK